MKFFLAELSPRPSEALAFPRVLAPLGALPDDFHAVLNVHFPGEIDILILSRVSVIALEVKAWGSAVALKDDRQSAGDDFFHAPIWRHDKPADPSVNLRENPIQAVRRKARDAGACIQKLCGLRLPCFPLLVFPNWRRPPGSEAWIPDGFGRVFFQEDLSYRLAEFVGSHSFEKANAIRNPDCKTCELTEAIIRQRLIPKGFSQRQDWRLPPQGAPRPSPPAPENNFQISGPVSGRRFIGMAAPLQALASRLRSPGHMYLAGMRRTGKTSLALRAAELGLSGQAPFNRSSFVTLNFFSDCVCDRACALYSDILRRMIQDLGLSFRVRGLELAEGDERLREKVRRMLERPCDLVCDAGPRGTREVFREALLILLAAFREKRPGWRAVLVLDEFSDAFLRAWRTSQAPAPRRPPPPEEAPVSADDLKFIGSLTREREIQRNCSFIVIGKPYMTDLDRRLKTEVFAGLPEIPAGLLARNDMEALVSRLASPVGFGSELMGRLWDLTLGHPYYVQLLCDSVLSCLEPGREKALAADLEAAVEAVAADDSKFSFELTDYDLKSADLESRPLEQLHSAKLLSALARMAEPGGWAQREELFRACKRTMRMDEKQAHGVLLGLSAARVVETRSGGNQPEVRIGVPLLALWMRKKDLFTACSMVSG
jgi:hypothetical protein